MIMGDRLPGLFAAFRAPVITKIGKAVIQLIHPMLMVVAVENLPRKAVFIHPFADLRSHRYRGDRALVGVVTIETFLCLSQLPFNTSYLLSK